MSSMRFTQPCGIPADSEYPLWAIGQVAKLWDGDGWKAESMSWKTGCYIHGGLSGPGQIRYFGEDVVVFLESIFVNNFSRFKVGTAKHAIACDSAGLITGHGVLQRLDEKDFRLFVHGLWVPYQFSKTRLRVHQEFQNNYLFQIAGPWSGSLLSSISREDISNLAFLRFRDIEIGGVRCEIMRIGMAGSLAYELHGPIEDGPAVYSALLNADSSRPVTQLGWKTYYVNHIEGGFPQQTWTFLPSTVDDAEFKKFASTAPTYRVGPTAPLYCGSVPPEDKRARFRTPCEVGWERSVVFDHDFIGRHALEKEHLAPRRTIATLEWNSEDVLAVQRSYFADGAEYKQFEFPVTPQFAGLIGHADYVLKNGVRVGIASGIAYSFYYRRMISHCTIDTDQAYEGNEVVVVWGDSGTNLKEIRATVARYPYLNENRNQTG